MIVNTPRDAAEAVLRVRVWGDLKPTGSSTPPAEPMWYCYYLMRSNRNIVYIGITDRSPTRRETDHRVAEGKVFSYMTVQDSNHTEYAARQWKQRHLAEYRRTHDGQNPLYNRDL